MQTDRDTDRQTYRQIGRQTNDWNPINSNEELVSGNCRTSLLGWIVLFYFFKSRENKKLTSTLKSVDQWKTSARIR